MKGKIAIGLVIIGVVAVAACFIPGIIQRNKDREVGEIATSHIVKKEDFEEEEEMLDFSALWEINPDIYAWIRIPGTDIDYPVLQATEDEEEDYYLDHNVYKDPDKHGAIYSQWCNKKDFSDRVTILYGHNMTDGSMFKQLHKYRIDGFMEDHQTIEIYTPDEKLTYRVFAAYEMPARVIMDEWEGFPDELSVQNYITEIRSFGGVQDRDVKVVSNRQILTLSTCNSDSSKRFIIQAFLIDNYANDVVR